MAEARDDALATFFTIGLTERLEPLPKLSYELLTGTLEADEEFELQSSEIEEGQRLGPKLESFPPQSLHTIKRFAQEPSIIEAVTIWKKLFILLDAADNSTHFDKLRNFFDHRVDTSQLTHSEEIEGDHPEIPKQTERRNSFFTVSRVPKHGFGFARRATFGDADKTVPRPFMGSIRRPSRRACNANDASSPSDIYELWTNFDGALRCVRFNIRLDLHNARLAPMPQFTDTTEERVPQARTFSFGRRDSIYSDPTCEDPGMHPQGASSSRSFVQRMFERGRRRSQAASSPWTSTHEDLYDESNAVAVDSDDEHMDDPSLRMRNSSATSFTARSNPSMPVPKHADLGRVEEGSAFDPNDMNSSDQDDTLPSFIYNGEDFLTLLRRGSEALLPLESLWPTGESDPMPTVLTMAMAEAFGWEGILHLCYGSGSACEQEGMYGALGRAAEMDKNRRKKYEAVLSWRQGVQMEQGSDDVEPVDTYPADDVSSLPSRHSNSDGTFASDLPRRDSQVNHTFDRVSHVFLRTWADWSLLLESINAWVSEYESVRIRHGLAHEMGQEQGQKFSALTQAQARRQTRTQPSASLEADALNGWHGFWRLPGVPDALRDCRKNGEHLGYRWARTRLLSTQVGSSMVLSTASAQFILLQLSTKPWVFQSSWELGYLDDCVFQSNLVQTRFPPPGDSVAPPIGSNESHRCIACPNPSPDGAWDALEWRVWLSTLQAGQVIVPAVSWQGWWTLLALLNGADRTDRPLDLQLRAQNEPAATLDQSSIYI